MAKSFHRAARSKRSFYLVDTNCGSGIRSYHLEPSRFSKSQELRRAAADSDAALTQVRTDCQQRVSEVEEEMRSLLLAMERQKAKSAAKVQQLSAFLEDLKRSS